MEVEQVSSIFVTSKKTLGSPEKEPEIFASEPGLSNKEHISVPFLGNRKSSLKLKQMETTHSFQTIFSHRPSLFANNVAFSKPSPGILAHNIQGSSLRF